jgi:hypothetical protein
MIQEDSRKSVMTEKQTVCALQRARITQKKKRHLVAVHSHALRVSAEFTIGSRRDGSAAMALSTALLECEQLLGTESLVVDLRGGLDKILEVSSQEEVSERHKFAMALILYIDDSPTILTSAHLLAIDNDGLLRTDDSEWNKALESWSATAMFSGGLDTNLDLAVDSTLLIVQLLAIVGIHLEVVESKLLLDALLESLSLLQCQAVRLGDDGDNIDNIGELLQDNDIDRLQRVSGRLDKKQAAVDAGILNISLSLGSELLAQVGRVLVLDILDDRVPAAIVVDQVAIARGVNNVELEADTILLNDMRNGVNLGSRSNGLVGEHTTLCIDQVGGKNGIDQGRLAQTGLTFASCQCFAVSKMRWPTRLATQETTYRRR